MNGAIERLAKAVGYPESIPAGLASYTLLVDGAKINAEETLGRIVLSYVFTGAEEYLPTLASYAPGRMLREEATLAYGESGGKTAPFLWQAAPEDADAHSLARLFETFMDSCDWWRARVEALRGGAPSGAGTVDETIMIRP